MSNPNLTLSISLNALEHLGINLYSNMAAVLSEIVANGYDADAECINVTWDKENDCVIIQDDGSGMTTQEVNERFLTVGYRRRAGQPGLTLKHQRKPMGRKGIGKLSLFSIADTVMVETAKDGEKSAFLMRLPDIREQIEKEGGDDTTYQPEILDTKDIGFPHGTRITLTNLNRKQTVATPKALRKRIARRFLVKSDNFHVFINDAEVTVSDREYYDKIQYLWTYGDQKDVINMATNKEHHKDRIVNAAPGGVNISGWLGTVKESRQLKDDEDGDNLNRIAVFVRGKMAQGDILEAFTERGVYASYLIGELRVDGLDLWDGDDDRDDDAATSSRQSLVEGDPRYLELKEFIAAELKFIQSKWGDLRIDSGSEKALEIPEVAAWIANLKASTSAKAKKWIGKLNKINIGEVAEKRSLIKQAVLAFEFHRLNENLERLENIEDEGVSTLLELFGEIDGLEANLYGQIVKSRLGVIRTLEEKVDDNALEKVIQEYIFDHLWLIDPAWERAEATVYMERQVGTLLKNVDAKLTAEQKAGRIDIGYRKTAGKHVIVELKRPNRKVTTIELIEQIGKYRSGLRAILEKADRGNEPIEIIILLGEEPTDWVEAGGRDVSDKMMEAQSARFVFYASLMETAHRIYQAYLEKRGNLDKLQGLMSAIDDYSPDDT